MLRDTVTLIDIVEKSYNGILNKILEFDNSLIKNSTVLLALPRNIKTMDVLNTLRSHNYELKIKSISELKYIDDELSIEFVESSKKMICTADENKIKKLIRNLLKCNKVKTLIHINKLIPNIAKEILQNIFNEKNCYVNSKEMLSCLKEISAGLVDHYVNEDYIRELCSTKNIYFDTTVLDFDFKDLFLNFLKKIEKPLKFLEENYNNIENIQLAKGSINLDFYALAAVKLNLVKLSNFLVNKHFSLLSEETVISVFEKCMANGNVHLVAAIIEKLPKDNSFLIDFAEECVSGVDSVYVVDKEDKISTLDLVFASSVKIKRHIKIKGEANPFDPVFRDYFRKRDKRSKINSRDAGQNERYLPIF